MDEGASELETRSFQPFKKEQEGESAEDKKTRIRENWELFRTQVDKVNLLNRNAQRAESTVVTLDTKLQGAPDKIDFPQLVDLLGINNKQLFEIFDLEKDSLPQKKVIEVLQGFKKEGIQNLANILEKPIETGNYDGFMNTSLSGKKVNPTV